MAASLSTIVGKDGNGATIVGAIQALDLSGAGTGPWSFANVIVDGAAGTLRAGVTSGGALKIDGTATNQPVNIQLAGTAVTGGAGATAAGTPRVTLASDSPGIIATGSQASPSASYLSSVVAGDVAAAASDSGNPVKIGGVGHTALPSAVTDGQRANAMFDKFGRQVNVPHAVRDLVSDQTTSITATTAATTIVTADASNMLDLVGLILANTSSTGSEVSLYNDDGTTLRATFYAPANDTRGIVFPVPFKQTAVNKTWKMITVTSISSLKVTAQFVKNQ